MTAFNIQRKPERLRGGSYVYHGTLEFEVEVPSGFVPVAFRVPRRGERYLYGNTVAWCSGKMKRSFLVLRRKKKGDAFGQS